MFWDGADLINAAIYAKEGNWVEAGKCVACALPFIGTAIAGVTKGSKIAKVGKTVGTVLKAAGKTYMTAEAAKTSLELAGDAKMQYAVEGKVSASLVAKTAGAVAMAGVAALSGVSLMKDVRSLSKAAEVSFSTRIQKNAEIDAGQSVSKASNGVSQGASGVSVTSGEIAPASIRKMSDGPMVTAGKRGSDFYVTSGGTAIPKENYHSMSNVDVRKWYLSQEAKIPELIDTSQSLENQAYQAFSLRNEFRTTARELMADRATAESLYITDPNRTWEQMVNKQINNGLIGDDIYRAIINSSQKSRPSVNKSLGLE